MSGQETNVKASVIEVLETLPEGATWQDVMYALYVRKAIEEGLESVAAGRTVPYQDVLREFRIKR